MGFGRRRARDSSYLRAIVWKEGNHDRSRCVIGKDGNEYGHFAEEAVVARAIIEPA